MSAPADLYIGQTVHERRQPFTHRFNYRISSLMVDLERLNDAAKLSRFFSVEKFNLYSFFERDHGARDGSSLLEWARARFSDAGLAIGDAKVRLLCAPRVLGYVFNPLSIYFAEDRETNELKGVIYQVHNTFGDAHAYVAPCSGQSAERQAVEKIFHVSPFFDVGGRYEFTLRQPDDRFKLSILKERKDGSDFLATMAMNRVDLTTSTLMGLFVSQPFSTLKTISAIHLEALKLWAKGAKYHSRPEPPDQASLARASTQNSERLGPS